MRKKREKRLIPVYKKLLQVLVKLDEKKTNKLLEELNLKIYDIEVWKDKQYIKLVYKFNYLPRFYDAVDGYITLKVGLYFSVVNLDTYQQTIIPSTIYEPTIRSKDLSIKKLNNHSRHVREAMQDMTSKLYMLS